MPTLLEIRERLREFYAKYTIYIVSVLKFIAALVVLLLLNAQIGSMEQLMSPLIVIIAALFCSFMPINTTVLVAAVFALGHIYNTSLELAIITVMLFLVMFLLYCRFVPKDAYILLLLPVLFVMKIPYVVPLVAGLLAAPISAVSVVCGVIIYYILELARNSSTVLAGAAEGDVVTRLQLLLDAIVNNKEMILICIAFAATVVITYLIRRLSVDYAWYIAIGVGALSDMIILLAGDFMMNVSNEILPMIIGTIVSILICIVVQFLFFTVDYSGTEHVQYEDDEYYYYVKAVPKITVSTAKKTVRTINEKKPEVRRTNTSYQRTTNGNHPQGSSRER